MNKLLDMFNDEEEQCRFGADMRKYELYVIVPYIVPIFFFFPLLVDKESDFCKFHANQSLCWLIVFLLLEAASGIVGMISPVMRAFAAIITLFSIVCMAFLVIGALKGYAIKIPILGDIIRPFR